MYTHLVTVVRNVKNLGKITQTFRTTADAVALHSVALSKQVRAGRAVSFVVTLM